MQPSVSTVRLLGKAECLLLGGFLIALPLVEAPKNLLLGAYVLAWLLGSLRQCNFGTLSPGWDGLFAAMLVVPALSVLTSAPYPHGWTHLGDIVSYVLLGWTLARTRLTTRQTVGLLGCAVGATLLGIVHGYWVLAVDAKRIWLQLNSVGHVNHSALFGAGAGVLAGGLSLYASGLPLRWRRVSVVMALACFGGVVAFASRGAFVAYLAGLGVIAVPALFIHGWRGVRVAVVAFVLAGGVAFAAQGLVWLVAQDKNDSSLLQKTLENVREKDVTSARGRLARTALEYWRQCPWLGLGVGNFSAVSPAQAEAWATARGEVFVPEAYLFSNHAHNVYFNTLAERGALGLLVLLGLGVAWAVLLWQCRPRAASAEAATLAWASGVAGWSVVYIGGVFNTTLHHEHGMLSMLGLALLLGVRHAGAEGEGA